MTDLKLGDIQTYFEEETGEPLRLCFDHVPMEVDGVYVEVDGIPLLKNERTNSIHLPDKTKRAIQYFVQQAKNRGEDRAKLTPRGTPAKRYEYAKKFDFLYSHIDHEFIPGLQRSWDEGFLTPVFFNLALLNKYSQDPAYRLDLFSDTYGSIIKGDEINIQFGINRNKRVIMWLGDIGRLPDSEKYYLRSENVESDHDIHSEFYNAQIEVQWSDPSRQYALFHARNDLSEAIRSTKSFDLYKLEGEISKVITNLHRPVFWEDRHVGPVIESFNRIVVESIDPTPLKKELASLVPEDEIKGKGSLKIFGMWLDKCQKVLNVDAVMCPFYVLYDFRILTCHLQSDVSRVSMLGKINSRMGLAESNTDYECIYDRLIDSLAKSYQAILQAVMRAC